MNSRNPLLENTQTANRHNFESGGKLADESDLHSKNSFSQGIQRMME
jgi:hypothetical protein